MAAQWKKGNSSELTRRKCLAILAAAGAGSSVSRASGVPRKTDGLLEEVERRACQYFYEQAHPATGLVLDRSRAEGREDRRVASIAATGFGLSAMCIGHQRGYFTKGVAQDRVEKTLEFFARKIFRQQGFYFHFVDVETGQRAYNCELSSIDTAWLLCGIIHAREHFDTMKIRRLANEILSRVNWQWMWNGGPTLSHGWTPEGGFLPYRWDQYSELLAMYLLAIGSSTFPIPASSWDAWERPTQVADRGDLYIESPAPLFVHQYSHAWFDFRKRQDGYADYFMNSRMATLRHRDFCLGMRHKFPWFSEDMWGISASDSRYGYIDWGGPRTASNSKIDGTLVPCASGGSLVFLPDECGRVLSTMLDRYGKQVWTRYGFVDAFHPEAAWYSPDVIGIDLGIMLLMAENLRTQSVWHAMTTSPEAERGFKLAAFYNPETL
jgi:hypothetical protein